MKHEHTLIVAAVGGALVLGVAVAYDIINGYPPKFLPSWCDAAGRRFSPTG
jgi:hypothetical protein